MKSLVFNASLVVLGMSVTAWLAGCAPSSTDNSSASDSAAQQSADAGHDENHADGDEHADHDGHSHEGHDHGDHGEGGDGTEIAEALAKLPEADRALAEQQKVCPVSEEPLGAMGTPIKLTVGDQTVFICCDGCRATIEAEPEKYLAKLKSEKSE